MLDKFKNMGWKKYYLIYGMCDETFSVNYSADIPEDVDRGWFYFWVTLFNQLYWVSGLKNIIMNDNIFIVSIRHLKSTGYCT